MFGLFRKKIDKEAQERQKFAHDATVTLLAAQLDLGDVADFEQRQRLFTPYGVGYLLGFATAHFREAGVSKRNDLLASLTVAFSRIFNEEVGSRIVGVSFGLEQDDDYQAGHKLGEEEAMRWYTERGFTPHGLSDHMSSWPLLPDFSNQ